MSRKQALQRIHRAATKKAEVLDLSELELTEVPPEVTQLVNLQRLSLSSNQISVIPDSIAQLVNLQKLSLSGNQINVIPDSIAQLVNLQMLDLSSNRISLIPDSITQLIKLQKLSLRSNQIRGIPDSIAQLVKLRTFYLMSNQISVIPDSIAQLVNLQMLDLRSNRISVIPDSIAQLIKLQTLDLNRNQIRIIPNSIVQLVYLRRLGLEDNPINNIPPEIIQGREEPQAIFAYLKATTKHPLNELKVLLVGEGDVGKTSLFKALTGQPFDAEERKTPGINIQPWNITKDSQSIRLNLWDFGGQKVMHNTHQFFLTKRSLYILVLDNRKNEAQNRIEYWLKLIETYGGDSPVIIVGNCADENPLQIKIRTLQKKYPQIKEAISTSAKKGTGIKELRKAIIDQIDQIPHVHDLLPVSWFALKQQLEAMRNDHDFISYEKYQTLCQAADITTPQAQKSLIGFLHDLGVVLNYQDPEYTWLNETNVLNPEWVTSGIYDILNNHDLTVKHKGILVLPTLNTILKQPDRYPENKRPFLMGLMEKFELSFQLDGTPPRYLISDLLDPDEPDVDIYETAPLHFQYHYDILPSSIISRFIVRNHTMIYRTMRWRSGCVLTQNLCKALVRADEEDNRISIKLQGNRSSALLATIRADFNKIHNNIPHLAVREYLVIREIQDDKPTGREVPIDYNYLCDLDREGITEASLPELKGKYNPRDILEGIESRKSRLSTLDDRRNKSNKSRNSRPLKPRKRDEKPGLITTSSLILVVFAIVAAIFAGLARYIPGFKLALIIPAILLAFSAVIIPILRIRGVITEEAFNQGLAGFFKALPVLNGKDPEKEEDEPAKLPAESSKKD
jgi:internalin A